MNPRAGHETELLYAPTQSPKHIAVVGSGPAGMMAAAVAAERGHRVTLFEKDKVIGGQLNMARVIPGKEEFDGLVDWFAAELSATGVDVRLGVAATSGMLTDFDEVIVATGVLPRSPEIRGQDGPNVLSYIDVLRGGAPVGRRVAVVGAGGIGFDVAEFLVHAGESPTCIPELWREEWGVADPEAHRSGLSPEGPRPTPPAREVTLLQRKAEKPGKRLGKTTGWIHRASLQMKNVRMVAGVTYEWIDAEGLHITHGPARERPEVVACDTVVLCAGQVSERSLADDLIAAGRLPRVIGGADLAAELDAKRAIDQGARIAASL